MENKKCIEDISDLKKLVKEAKKQPWKDNDRYIELKNLALFNIDLAYFNELRDVVRFENVEFWMCKNTDSETVRFGEFIFCNCSFALSKFESCDFSDGMFDIAYFVDSTFDDCGFINVSFSTCQMQDTTFEDCNFCGAKFRDKFSCRNVNFMTCNTAIASAPKHLIKIFELSHRLYNCQISDGASEE